MIDKYSDEEIEDNFEEEYLDDELEESKQAKPPIKNDFWEAPKKQANNITTNQKATVPIIKPAVLPSNSQKNQVQAKPQVQNNPKGIIKDGDDEGDEYEEDDFDEDEEENFKKTAADFAKQLNQLKTQNDKRKEIVDKLEKDAKQQKGGGSFKLPQEDDNDDEYEDDDFDKEFENIVNKQQQASKPAGVKIQSQIPTNQHTKQGSLAHDSRIQQQQQVQPKSYNQQSQQILSTKEASISSPSKSVVSKVVINKVEERNPYKFIEKTLIDARTKLDKMKGTSQLLDTLSDNSKKKKFLKSENKQLRDQLKKMSENVNLLIDKMNQESIRKKKFSQNDSERPGSQKIRAREKEVQNTDKAIQNLIKEHQRVKKRLEEVQTPDFLMNLKKNIRNSEKEIKDYEKMLQQLHVEQVRREKRLDKIIEKNEPETLKQINDSTARLAYLNEKIGDLRDQQEKAEKLKQQQVEHLEELKQRMEKLQQIAEHYGIEVDKHEENKLEYEKLNKDLAQLDKQKKIVLSAIDTMTKKYESAVTDKKKEYESLYYKKAMILKSYNEKIKMLKLKGQEIQELIEKAKTGADKGLIEILTKWEEANQKIFEKYPDEDGDYSILEAAVTEVKKIEYNQNYSDSKQQQQEIESSRKGKKKKEEEDMRKYMEELKKKEEEMQAKVEVQVKEEKEKQKKESELQAKLKKDQLEKDKIESQRKKDDEENKRKQQQFKQEEDKKKKQEEEEKRKQEQEEILQKQLDEERQKKSIVASKPFTTQRKTQPSQPTLKSNQNPINDSIQDEAKDDIGEEIPEDNQLHQQEESKVSTQQQQIQPPKQEVEPVKKPGSFSKPAFMMKKRNDGLGQNNDSVNYDDKIQSQDNGSIQNQKAYAENKPTSFTEKYGINNNNSSNQGNAGGILNTQSSIQSINTVGNNQPATNNALQESQIPILGTNQPRTLQQPSYQPNFGDRRSQQNAVNTVQSSNEPVKKQIADPFAKYDNYDPLQKYQPSKPAGQIATEQKLPIGGANLASQASLTSNNAVPQSQEVQNQPAKFPWDTDNTKFEQPKIIGQQPQPQAQQKQSLWEEKPQIVQPKQNLWDEKPSLAQPQQNLWEEKPTLVQPKQNLWDEKPQLAQPNKANLWEEKPSLVQPKANLWDEKPSDFKTPVVPEKQKEAIQTIGGYSVVNKNSSNALNQQSKGESNDYLSMISDNKNRQPRMRIGMGNSNQQQQPKPKAGGGTNIMSGLDELEDLS